MSSLPLSNSDTPLWKSLLPSRQTVPFLTTCMVFLVLYIAACMRYEGFFSFLVGRNLITSNATLAITAIGMTFVIMAGGIDLSVGSVIAATSVFLAIAMAVPHLEADHPTGWAWNPGVAIFAALCLGTLLGLAQGALIHFFTLPPFLVTLGGLFFARGYALMAAPESVSIRPRVNHTYYVLTKLRFQDVSDWLPGTVLKGAFSPLVHLFGPKTVIPFAALAFVVLLAFAVYVAARRPIGRNVYALGGSEQSALLMGLPVARTKIGVYAFSGFCAALAGVASTIATPSGDATRAVGLELDAIAAVVVGGTLLTGGVGGPRGTFVGILIFGVIKEVVLREGVDSSLSRIATGALLLIFILLQKFLQPRESNSH